MDSNGYPIGGVGGEDGVTTNDIVSLDTTAQIELGDGAINFVAASVEIAGVPIIDINSGVSNPMLADLDANEFNISNVGEINGINLGILQNNIVTLNNKTFYIDPALSLDGTIFTNNVYALSFVKDGGTNQQYLMADGSSLQYSANSGNSNFYLYTSRDTITPNPANGEITYNNANQSAATTIYINHRTSDNIDIEVYFKQLSTLNEVYIQDKNLSENFIQYNITGTPTILTNDKVIIPVTVRISGGTGATSFGGNHPVLLSFFTNGIEADQRITTLESKTQNMTATTSINTLSRSLNSLLQPADFVAIRSIDGLTNHAIFTPTAFNFYRPLNMNVAAISNAASLSISGGTSGDFLKADGTLDSNSYALVSSLSGYLPLTGGSLTGDIEAAQFIKIGGLNTEFLKANGESDATSYASDAELAAGLALKLDLTGGTLTGPLNMGGFDISNGGIISGNSISLVGSPLSFLMADGSANPTTYLPTAGGSMTGSIDMGSANINNALVITANSFKTPTGLAEEFLKADGSIDANFYMKADTGYSAGSVAYVNSLGELTSNTTNRYCQAVQDQLQTFINTMPSGLDYEIRLSAGVHTVTNLSVYKIAYSINGVSCPQGESTTTINGATTIGQAGQNTSLIKFCDIIFNGTVTIFSNPATQQTRHSFYNCIFNSTFTFPTSVQGASGYLYFYDCYFTQAAGITFNNIVCSIKFMRCRFNNAAITNNSPAGSVIFDTCSGLNSLNVTNAVYRGVNLSFAGVSQLTAGSLALSGAATSFVMGNGSLNTQLYSTITTLTGNFVFNGVNCAFQARRVSDGVNGGVVSIFVGGFLATIATTGNTFISNAVLPVGWRPINAVFNSGRIRRNNNVTAGTVIFFASGEMGLTDTAQTNNFWNAGNTNCGLATDASFSWPVL